jgi:Sec-independent protein secretion pathway component TatC
MTTSTDPAGLRTVIRRTTVALILALIVQFLIGMLVSLFVTIPDSHPGS